MQSLESRIGNICFSDERLEDILLRRINGNNLDTIGGHYKLTRERIRQLQEKALWEVALQSGGSLVTEILSRVQEVKDSRSTSSKYLKYLQQRRKIVASLDGKFDHQELCELLGVDYKSIGDLDICVLLYDNYKICWYWDYIHCTVCHSPKPCSDFNPRAAASAKTDRNAQRVCRTCNTRRQNTYMSNPEIMARAIERQRAQPNRQSLYQARHIAKVNGTFMPPIPPSDIHGEIPPIRLAKEKGGWDNFWKFARKWKKQQAKKASV